MQILLLQFQGVDRYDLNEVLKSSTNILLSSKIKHKF